MSVPHFPEPPAGAGALPTHELRPAQPFYRIHATHHAAVYFNPTTDYRFNAPAGEFGVLYAALSIEGAFVETFCRTVNAAPPLITTGQLAARGLARLTVSSPLRLVDLTGAKLAMLGIDNRISTSDDYALVQRWSRYFWAHADGVHGLLYRSRHDPEQVCVALYAGRADPLASPLANSLSAASFARELGQLVGKYGAAIL